MSATAIRFTKGAKSDLARLDKAVAMRIVKRTQWLGEHLDDTVLLPKASTSCASATIACYIDLNPKQR